MSDPVDKKSCEDSDSEDSKSKSKDAQPGFTFSKSAIADLPSTAVQSIHIENDKPVEVDDDVFVWRDHTPSGTKLAAKTKLKKQDTQKTGGTCIKQKTSATNPIGYTGGKPKAKSAPPPKTSTSLAGKEKVSVKTIKQSTSAVNSKHQSKTSQTGSKSLTKVASVDSKNRVKEQSRLPSVTSQTSQGKNNSKAKVTPTREKHTDKQNHGKAHGK